MMTGKKIIIKSIIVCVSLLIVCMVGISYAKVDNYDSNILNDNQLISYSYDDGSGTVTNHTVPPAQGSGYVLTNLSCTGGQGSWDNATWSINISNITGKIKCRLSFEISLDDGSPSAPELYDGLIPVVIGDGLNGTTKGEVIVADEESDWYDYENHKWANAVVVSNPSSYQVAGTTIPQSDILQMYVWIPRYRYQLFNS